MNKYGDYVSIADVIQATGSNDFDLSYHEMSEAVNAEDLSYNDLGVVVFGVVKIVCKSPRLAFAKALGLWPEPEMKQITNNGLTLLHCENTISPPKMEDRLTVGQWSVIGAPGFGYERDNDGGLIRIKHFGRVVIGKKVHIHNNVCIDRGVIGDTVIGDGVAIDNLVHVAHNAKIGKNTLIVAGAVIGGSVEIGENCFIGMNASIKQKVKIGNNVTVGAGAVVLKDIPDGETWVGNPAKRLVGKEHQPPEPPNDRVRRDGFTPNERPTAPPPATMASTQIRTGKK